MIKVENNEINIYRKFDKKSIKEAQQALKVAGILAIFIFIMSLISFIKGEITIVLIIIDIFLIIFTFVFYYLAIFIEKKFENSEPKLSIKISNDKISFYNRDKSVNTFDKNIIDSFAILDDGVRDVCFINYFNSKNKKRSDVICVVGCSKHDFIDIANNWLKVENYIESFNPDDSENKINVNDDNEDNEEISTLEKLENGEIVNASLVGKKKIYYKNGNIYNVNYLFPGWIFIDDNANILDFLDKEIEFDDKNIDFENKYQFRYDKRYRKFVASKIEERVNEEQVNKARKNINIAQKIVYDKDLMNIEFNLIRNLKIFGIIFALLEGINVLIKIFAKNSNYFMGTLCIGMFVLFGIFLVNIIQYNKLMKVKDNKKR